MSMKLQQSAAETNQNDAVTIVDNSLVEKVWHDLDGEVSREQVRRVVAEIATAYQDAPVQVFVPILIHRQALERLKISNNINSHPAAGQTPVDGKQRRSNKPAAAPIINKHNKGKFTMKKLTHLLHLSILIFMLAACSGTAVESTDNMVSAAAESAVSVEADTAVTSQQTVVATAVPVTIKYDSEDLETSAADSADTTTINLEGDAISVVGEGAVVNGSSVTITAAGTYCLSGTLTNGQIVVETADEDPVVLILNGVDITYAASAPIYVSNAEKAIITLADGTNNVLTDGDTYQFPDAETHEPNATLFSNDDLTINGSGSLTVNANYNNGIDSDDDLKIVSGDITVNAVNDGIKGRDSIAVKDGVITINAGGDGMQSNNDEDVERGYIAIEGGAISITAALDGIQAETSLLISGSEINIVTASEKGLIAGADLTIMAGTININAADDAVHSNGTMTINGGSFTLATNDDGMHADATLVINDGTIDIQQSYEGLEATDVIVNGGVIDIISSDDGINGAGGNDSSGVATTAGRQDRFSSSQGTITVNGGTITIAAAGSGNGDGLDANGELVISGGDMVIKVPTSYRDYSNIDFDTTFSLTGGSVRTLDANGAYTEVTSADVGMMGGPGGGPGGGGRP